MCPACMAAAALTAAKVASVGGLTAYGVKKLVDLKIHKPKASSPESLDRVPPTPGASHEEPQNRVA